MVPLWLPWLLIACRRAACRLRTCAGHASLYIEIYVEGA
jgi:hypothetical protein